ncbi:neuropeptides capa receptor-like isoform X2 [Neodiprion pinetum]|uniref:neuropeptides capa receptor-like isoform X2 n=1 Tax=Neodiprion pinetum TaxID=441929 RepID=UPI0037170025
MSSQMTELGSNAESDVGIAAQYFGSVGSSDRVAMNISENLYLAITWGQQYCDLDFAIPMTLTYVTIFITGVFGNVMTCLVVIRNPTMQTATNYYLFSLAISDLTLLLLGLPNELSQFWRQYPWTLGLALCKLRAYVSEMSSYVSVLTIVAFSMERYLAICHPLHLHAMSGLKRPLRFILAAWLVGIICAIPFGVYMKINYLDYPPGSRNPLLESAVCAMLFLPDFPIYQLSCAIFFLVPMIVILVLYTAMGLQIRKTTRSTLGQNVDGVVHGEVRQIQSRRGVIRMLSAVVITFFLCWAPFHAQRVLYVYGVAENWKFYDKMKEQIFVTSGILYYFSATVNPILYNVMSAKYRTAFKELLCCCFGRANQSNRTITLNTYSLCQCNSGGSTQLTQLGSSKHPSSVRCTIHGTKKSPQMNSEKSGFPPSKGLDSAENGTNEPLLNSGSTVEENRNGRPPLQPSDSTASSNL